ncbi:MAG: PilZ domain-containing protein [Fibrobacterota bacterium]
MEDNNAEKRKKVRIPFIYGIEFDDAGEVTLLTDKHIKEGETKITIKDISADGMQIASLQFIPEGAEIKLLVRFPRWRGVPKDIVIEDTNCVIHARVQWTCKNSSEKAYRAGLLFTKLRDESREIINRYLDDNIIIEEELM